MFSLAIIDFLWLSLFLFAVTWFVAFLKYNLFCFFSFLRSCVYSVHRFSCIGQYCIENIVVYLNWLQWLVLDLINAIFRMSVGRVLMNLTESNLRSSYTGWLRKTSQTLACVMHWSSLDKSVVKHVCNEQTFSNTSRNFRSNYFLISRDTNTIVFCITSAF